MEDVYEGPTQWVEQVVKQGGDVGAVAAVGGGVDVQSALQAARGESSNAVNPEGSTRAGLIEAVESYNAEHGTDLSTSGTKQDLADRLNEAFAGGAVNS